MLARKVAAVAMVCVVLGGCGTPAEQSGALQPGSGSAASVAATPQTSTAAPASVAASTAPAASPASPIAASPASQGTEMERSAIEKLVVDDLARYLSVPAAEIGVTGAEERTWVGPNLGCGSRDLEGDSLPVPGYLITLQHGPNSYPYHTDRAGKFVRCRSGGKPLGPITR